VERSLKIGILINGSSTKTGKKSEKLRNHLSKLARRYKIKFIYKVTRSSDEALSELRDLYRNRIKILGIAGGDGTVQSKFGGKKNCLQFSYYQLGL
jgi:diacylglycerol kinase family enzyme